MHTIVLVGEEQFMTGCVQYSHRFVFFWSIEQVGTRKSKQCMTVLHWFAIVSVGIFWSFTFRIQWLVSLCFFIYSSSPCKNQGRRFKIHQSHDGLSETCKARRTNSRRKEWWRMSGRHWALLQLIQISRTGHSGGLGGALTRSQKRDVRHGAV